MATFLMTAVRCDCGGKLGWATEETERGRRWVHVCEGCGRRWGLRDGVFGPLDRGDSVRHLGDGTPEESALLACFCHLSDYNGPGTFTHCGPGIFTQRGPPVFTKTRPLLFTQSGA